MPGLVCLCLLCGVGCLKVLVWWWSALDFSKAAAEMLRDPKSNKKYENRTVLLYFLYISLLI